jgi:hypothetical protein
MAVGVAFKFLEVHWARTAGLVAAVKPPEVIKASAELLWLNAIVLSNLQRPPAAGAWRTVFVDYIEAHLLTPLEPPTVGEARI